MIFKALQIRKMIKEGTEDPGKFAGNQVSDLFIGIFVLPIIAATTLLGGLFILGFTSILGGPYSFFRFFFFISIFCVFTFFMILRKMYKMIKKNTKHVVDRTIKVDSKIVE